jgi:hypothetical protein
MAGLRLSRARLTSVIRASALACAPYGRAARPHFLQIVEGADLGPENMDDHVTRIDQHPVAMRHSFDARRETGFVEVLHHAIGDRSHMAVRSPRRHHHVVGDRRPATEIEGYSVLGLHFVEAREDEAKRLFSVGTAC